MVYNQPHSELCRSVSKVPNPCFLSLLSSSLLVLLERPSIEKHPPLCAARSPSKIRANIGRSDLLSLPLFSSPFSLPLPFPSLSLSLYPRLAFHLSLSGLLWIPLTLALHAPPFLSPSSTPLCPVFGGRRRSGFADARRNLTRSPPTLRVSRELVTALLCSLIRRNLRGDKGPSKRDPFDCNRRGNFARAAKTRWTLHPSGSEDSRR